MTFKATTTAALVALSTTFAAGTALAQEEVRPGVFFAGEVEPADSPRGEMQTLIFELATAWADCNSDAMSGAVAENVKFSYPTTAYEGLPTMLEDLNTFCGMATDVSIYMPEDAFYIDLEEGRVAVELQFRAFQRGAKQVVNDVWVATVEDGKITIIKEYLDGRVKDLQALGVLQLEESPAFLTPWPPRTEEWAECFPIAKAAPVNTCPPTA